MRPVVDDEVLDLFVRLAGIASPTGAEREVADVVKRYLADLGLGVHEDGSASVTGCGCGNLVARIPGRGEAPPIALCAHLDTVPVERAPQVVVADGFVRTDGATALGADDKAALAVILVLARGLVARAAGGRRRAGVHPRGGSRAARRQGARPRRPHGAARVRARQRRCAGLARRRLAHAEAHRGRVPRHRGACGHRAGERQERRRRRGAGGRRDAAGQARRRRRPPTSASSAEAPLPTSSPSVVRWRGRRAAMTPSR